MNILEVISPNKYEKKIVKIPLELIDRGINVNPRSKLVMETVEELVESIDFPEIHLGYLDGKLIIVDGYHRDAAAQRLDAKEILAYITEYKTLNEVKIDAFRENVNHGVKLTNYDIAAWIYTNFLEESKLIPTTTLNSFTKKCNVPGRTALALFKWFVVHKEVLEDDEKEVKTGDAEEFYSILTAFKEIPGSVSENFKIKFKVFYNKYNGILKRNELREAISLFKEGKDYNEEKEKEQKELERTASVVEEMEKNEWNESFEKIGDDAVDRNGNADYSEPKTESNNTNSTIENLIKEQEELNKEIKEEVKKETTNKIFATKVIDNISKSVMHLHMLNSKKKAIFTYNDLKVLEDTMDRIQEIIDNLEPDKLKSERDNNSI